MTNPAEAAHDADTGAPAEGVTLNEGETVDAPGLAVAVDNTKVYGYHAESNSLVDPYMGETWDGKDGWVKVRLVEDGGVHDDKLNVNIEEITDED